MLKATCIECGKKNAGYWHCAKAREERKTLVVVMMCIAAILASVVFCALLLWISNST